MSAEEEMRETSDPDRASLSQVSQMIAGGRIAQIVAVAAELGIPDRLKDGPCTDGELAEATGTHGPSLHRFMRALAALEMVRIEGDGYVLTPLGAALRSDIPERLDLTARYIGDESRWRTWGHLLDSIRTGRAAFPELFGMQSWEYGEKHPEFGRVFNEMMTVGSRRRQDAVLAAYDFSRFGTVVDVGGGHGQLLGALLVVDRVLPGERPPDVGAAISDLHMLVLLQGKERTEDEFRLLYERAGFRLTRVVPTESDVSLIEGVRI